MPQEPTAGTCCAGSSTAQVRVNNHCWLLLYCVEVWHALLHTVQLHKQSLSAPPLVPLRLS